MNLTKQASKQTNVHVCPSEKAKFTYNVRNRYIYESGKSKMKCNNTQNLLVENLT